MVWSSDKATYFFEHHSRRLSRAGWYFSFPYLSALKIFHETKMFFSMQKQLIAMKLNMKSWNDQKAPVAQWKWFRLKCTEEELWQDHSWPLRNSILIIWWPPIFHFLDTLLKPIYDDTAVTVFLSWDWKWVKILSRPSLNISATSITQEGT